MRSLNYHQGYDLLFTLVNPQPDVLDVDWSIQEAVKGESETFKIQTDSDICSLKNGNIENVLSGIHVYIVFHCSLLRSLDNSTF
jgi:hypothetical protein